MYSHLIVKWWTKDIAIDLQNQSFISVIAHHQSELYIYMYVHMYHWGNLSIWYRNYFGYKQKSRERFYLLQGSFSLLSPRFYKIK